MSNCEDCGRPYQIGSWETEEAVCATCGYSLGHGICAVESGGAFRYEDGVIMCEGCADDAETRPHASECGCDECETATGRKCQHRDFDAQRAALKAKYAAMYDKPESEVVVQKLNSNGHGLCCSCRECGERNPDTGKWGVR